MNDVFVYSIFVEDVDCRRVVLNRGEKCEREHQNFEEKSVESSQDMSHFLPTDSIDQAVELENKATMQTSNEAIKQVMVRNRINSHRNRKDITISKLQLNKL